MKKKKNHKNNAKMKIFVAIAALVIVTGLALILTPREKSIPSGNNEEIIENDDVVDNIPETPIKNTPETNPVEPAIKPQVPNTNVYTIEIKNLKFVPRDIEIRVGDTVRWVNLDMVGDHARVHVIKQAEEFMSPRLEYNQTFEHIYNESGEYKYIDSIFSSAMNGRIIVK